MIVGFLIFWPLLAALLLLLMKGEQVKKAAFAFSLIELLATGMAWYHYHQNPGTEVLKMYAPWIPSLGINFDVAMDGISILLVFLTTLLVPFIILSSFGKTYKNPRAFYMLILLMQMALVGVFVAMDGFLFYVFWELALIPIYFICLLWGGEGRARITFKFFIYTLFGSLFMLAALIYLYLHTVSPTGHSFHISALTAAGVGMTAKSQAVFFFSMFLAFAIKMPIFPFHTWQPDTYVNAPAQGTMLLSGIMLKMGTYGLLRWMLPIVPQALHDYGYVVIILAVISILYGSMLAIVQKDFKRLIAYSSIAHVGLIAAGMMAFNVQGLEGGLVQMISHGINVVGLFIICDMISSRTGTSDIASLGGIRQVAPGFALIALLIVLGSVALPLTNGFVGEFLLINGLFQYKAVAAFLAGLTIILGAVYMLRSYQKVMLGEPVAATRVFPDLTFNEKAVLIPLVILIFFFGIYPKPLLELAEPAVKAMVLKYNLGLMK
ncbi:MAG: NuoM family protein [Bacteroidia bacterium]